MNHLKLKRVFAIAQGYMPFSIVRLLPLKRKLFPLNGKDMLFGTREDRQIIQAQPISAFFKNAQVCYAVAGYEHDVTNYGVFLMANGGLRRIYFRMPLTQRGRNLTAYHGLEKLVRSKVSPFIVLDASLLIVYKIEMRGDQIVEVDETLHHDREFEPIFGRTYADTLRKLYF